MKILVIGGGQFVGAHFVDAALVRGHVLTLFNRGRTGRVPPGARHVVGDRKGDLVGLAGAGENWDAVVDTCGYLPRDLARMVDALAGRIGRYLFVSSISVYVSFAQPIDESAPLGTIDDPDTDIVDGRTYGPLKALCEQAVRQRLGDDGALVVRPGLVVGPRDPTGRFTYWPARIARAAPGEPVLLPGTPGDRLQFIDARDLAAFMLRLIEDGRSGTFNADSPPGRFDVGTLAAACAEVAVTAPRFVYAGADRIEALGLKPWSDLPVWLAPSGDTAAFADVSTAAAEKAGLVIRPLEQTVADTLAWWRGQPEDVQWPLKAGLTTEREAAALARLAASENPTP